MSDVPTREMKSAKIGSSPLLSPGQVVAGYQVERLVGKGGMGEVYRARQLSMDREVALKILSPQLAVKDPSFAKRFVEEARAAGKLNHSNIVHVHDVGTAELPDGHDKVHFFSMEFIDGESVQQILDREKRLDPLRIGQVMSGVAEALTVAAKAGIVHRDIKPDNIMITRGGLVKVADLGLAIPSQSGDDHAPERDDKGRARVMGTPLYLSPEQARALPVDHRSDQYSLGATLFHLLTGEAPFRGPDGKSIMKAHVVEPVPDPASRLPGIDEAWRQLCMRLMAKKPEERFAAPQDLVEAVDAACAGITLLQLARRKRGFRVPKALVMWGLLAGGLMLLVLAFVSLISHGTGALEPAPDSPPGPAAIRRPAPAVPLVSAPAPVPPPAAKTETASADLAAFDQALADQRLKDAEGLLATLDPTAPPVVAAVARFAAARAEIRRVLGAEVATAKAAELDAIVARVMAKPLPDGDREWLQSEVAARRVVLTPVQPPVPGDAERWHDLARQLDRCRAGLAYGDIRGVIEQAAMSFEKPEAKELLTHLADLGPLGQNGEGALRAYIAAIQPQATVVLDGKEVEVLLHRLTRTEVFYVVQKPIDPDAEKPEAERKVARGKIGLPWAVLLDEALHDQGVENPAQVKAACLWMWALPEAVAAFKALGDAPLTKAVAVLEKHRK